MHPKPRNVETAKVISTETFSVDGDGCLFITSRTDGEGEGKKDSYPMLFDDRIVIVVVGSSAKEDRVSSGNTVGW